MSVQDRMTVVNCAIIQSDLINVTAGSDLKSTQILIRTAKVRLIIWRILISF